MIQHIALTEIILYVNDQEKSKDFYEKIFRSKADLHVPGMTEFILSPNCKLGLMPNAGIAKIVSPILPHPETGNGIPRCELYFYVNDLQLEYDNALKTGAKEISGIENRNWGDTVCYVADPDGHVIAFATKTS
ncbi:MAG: lactoylglutathione lyase [Bacteroidota bacterium]|nr:lactoylglutathione lyase [Bacteroidota bacterium]